MHSDIPSYLKLGKAPDLSHPRDRALYRFFETIPGVLLWGTILFLVFFSWYAPVWTSVLVIAFDVYWLLKTLFFSVHLNASFKKMNEHMAVSWMEKLKTLSLKDSSLGVSSWEELYHLIILPTFKEPEKVLDESLEKILHSSFPAERMMLVLAVEENGGEEDREVARRMEEKYGKKFFRFFTAVHPKGVPGELSGKGSNETWAARRVKEEIIDPLHIPYERIIVSSLDSDTQVYPEYFSIVAYHYLTVSDPLHSAFQPIPVYNNNIWSVRMLSRIVAYSGTFWQMMQQARPERLTSFSSHSMPWKSLVEMDFWHVNIVSEDSRIFWQSLLFYNGQWKTVPLYYPVSMDANVGRTSMETAKNVYKQQRRWGWGVENVPYLLFGFVKNKKITIRKKLYFTFNQLEGFWSWGTNSLILFLFGWLPIIFGGDIFNTSVLSYNLPRVTRVLMTLAMLGVVSSSIISLKLLPPLPKTHTVRSYLWIVLQWFLLPITIIIFGSFPGIEAQTRLMLGRYMGFWRTPKNR